MAYLLKGALVEYGTDLLGPLPNVVLFQFNPEEMTRSLEIPERPTGTSARETSQAGVSPVESISFRAYFSAADHLKDNKVLARMFGVGPQLSALEKMVHPSAKLAGLLGQAIDAIGEALGSAGEEEPPSQPIPREKYPKILFIWGITRVLPVIITSMSIAEKKYDYLLNPVEAEVDLTLAVTPVDPCSDDAVARGAYEYSQIAKEVQAAANLVNTAEQIVELIPF